VGARWARAAVVLALAGCLDAPPGGVSRDAAADATASTCGPGLQVAPQSTFNASPSDGQNACAIENALLADGQEAGLDLFGLTEDGCAPLAPDSGDYGGCGCVGADFGTVLPLATVTIRARWTSDACGSPCTVCDQGRTIDVWVGEIGGIYRFVNHVGLTGDALLDYPFVTGGPVRYVVVCRDWYSQESADVAVDSIAGTCGE
jgi:hypothetical protein